MVDGMSFWGHNWERVEQYQYIIEHRDRDRCDLEIESIIPELITKWWVWEGDKGEGKCVMIKLGPAFAITSYVDSNTRGKWTCQIQINVLVANTPG